MWGRLREEQSATVLADYAEAKGFKVERGVAAVDGIRRELWRRTAGDRDHGRVRRAARDLADGLGGQGPFRNGAERSMTTCALRLSRCN